MSCGALIYKRLLRLTGLEEDRRRGESRCISNPREIEGPNVSLVVFHLEIEFDWNLLGRFIHRLSTLLTKPVERGFLRCEPRMTL